MTTTSSGIGSPFVVLREPVQSVQAALKKLSDDWYEGLVRDGTYTRDEVHALAAPRKKVSWVPPKKKLFGPVTFVAISGDRVIGGVDLYQNQRDGYWFLEQMIRDQAPGFHGVGKPLYDAAVAWLVSTLQGGYFELRVHSLNKEQRSLRFWTNYVFQRSPDFRDAFVKSRGKTFDAVYWISRHRNESSRLTARLRSD